MEWPYHKQVWPLHLLQWFLSLPFATLAWLRRRLYQAGLLASTKVETPVISVGNLTWGGTGKTPVISWLVNYLEAQGLRAALLTRGYKAQGEGLRQLGPNQPPLGPSVAGDEPWMLHLRHPSLPIYIQGNRVASARLAAKDADWLLLDDGMQHLKLQRDLDLCLIDHTRALGNGLVMPMGPLREPISSLQHADAIIITKANLPPAEGWQALRESLPDKPMFTFDYLPQGVVEAKTGQEMPLEWLTQQRVHLFCGLGNPQAFATSIAAMGIEVQSQLVLPDHGVYDNLMKQDLAKREGILLTTEKDYARLQFDLDQWPLFYWLKMEVGVPPEFTSWLQSRVMEIKNV